MITPYMESSFEMVAKLPVSLNNERNNDLESLKNSAFRVFFIIWHRVETLNYATFPKTILPKHNKAKTKKRGSTNERKQELRNR